MRENPDYLTKPGDMPIPAEAAEPPRTEPPEKDSEKHWLVQKATIAKMWRYGIAALVLVTLLDVFVHKHVYFGPEAVFGFYSAYGLIACIFMVLFAKALGLVISRPDDHYQPRAEDGE
ncbi:MAG: hypothetical protein ACYYKD_10010 [Rhodospirillales bacterium]